MTQEISLFRNFGLATPNSISYSEPMNAFVTKAQMYASGNSYFNAARFAEGLLIKEDVGQGHLYTFLNGVHIYDIKTRKLLTEMVFPMYQGAFYSKDTVKNISSRLLTNLIVNAAEKQGCTIDEGEVKSKIYSILNRAFANNQLQELEKHVMALEL